MVLVTRALFSFNPTIIEVEGIIILVKKKKKGVYRVERISAECTELGFSSNSSAFRNGQLLFHNFTHLIHCLLFGLSIQKGFVTYICQGL